MMMTKPAPEKAPEESKPKPKASPADAVADLERRLAQLSGPETPAASAPVPPPTVAPPALPAAAKPVEAPVKGGKNALLARIMAAQERAKHAQAPAVTPTAAHEEAPPPFEDDLLLSDVKPPPPAFDDSLVPPPAFDDSLLAPAMSAPPKPAPIMQWDPHAPMAPPPPAMVMTPPTPSAPAFEDLLDMGEHVKMPPPMQAPSQEQTGLDDDALAAILGMEGLSEEEKRALIQEQKNILAGIEAEKSSSAVNSAAARADAFEQRSHSAAVQAISANSRMPGQSTSASHVRVGDSQVQLHGQEQTRQAIEDGTAALVQCLACDNWMQVTKAATLMFCPVCQTVSPVVEQSMTADEEEQLKADLALAEKLQKEEYQAVERAEERARQKAATKKKEAEAAGGWMEWLGLASTPTKSSSPERPMSFAQPPVERGGLGVSRPPGSGLSSAQTDTITFSNSHDEEDALMGGGARVAQRQPLFNCVADSITSAATSLYTTHLGQDDEGNVHGVDSSSLLAVPQVGRETAYEKLEDRDRR